jgi:hypothetical protein
MKGLFEIPMAAFRFCNSSRVVGRAIQISGQRPEATSNFGSSRR